MFRNLRILVANVLMAFALCSASVAHNWYPTYCCSGRDCEKIVSLKDMGTNWQIITKNYNSLVPKSFEIRASQDGDDHYCMYQGLPRCLFLPLGINLIDQLQH